MEGRIDGHQHFWKFVPDEFCWIEPDSVLARDFEPSGLRPLLDAAGIGRSIVVQARQCIEETRYLLDLAAQNPWIAGVVGWIDLQSEGLADDLSQLACEPALVGFRHVVQDEPDPQFLARLPFLRGVQAVVEAGYTYDLLIRSTQLPGVPDFLKAFGPANIVIDHAAKPAIVRGEWEPWAGWIAQISHDHPGVSCKISGLPTEADPSSWAEAEIVRYLDHLLECFGADRLVYGSDWPVSLIAGSYARTHGMIRDWLDRIALPQREAIMGGNARRIYLSRTEQLQDVACQ